MGELERKIMELLWDAAAARTANELRDLLDTGQSAASGKPYPALTTVLTVLSRLEKKGLVTRTKSDRPHRYSPVHSRADHVAELMHQVLASTGEREAALARFVGRVGQDEAQTLRRLLAE